jgi:excisionase family DNA binding protein
VTALAVGPTPPVCSDGSCFAGIRDESSSAVVRGWRVIGLHSPVLGSISRCARCADLFVRIARVVNHLVRPKAHAVYVQNTDNTNNRPSSSSTRCLDTEQLGEHLGLSGRTIDRLRQTGAISYRRFGHQIRFAQEDVAEFLAQSRVVEGVSS